MLFSEVVELPPKVEELTITVSSSALEVRVIDGNQVKISYSAKENRIDVSLIETLVDSKRVDISSSMNKANSWWKLWKSDEEVENLQVYLPKNKLDRIKVASINGPVFIDTKDSKVSVLNIKTINANTKIATGATEVNYQTVNGIADIDVSESLVDQTISLKDINARTRIMMRESQPGAMNLSNRGHIEQKLEIDSRLTKRLQPNDFEETKTDIHHKSVNGHLVIIRKLLEMK